jgi:hypothetical protein
MIDSALRLTCLQGFAEREVSLMAMNRKQSESGVQVALKVRRGF